MLPAPNPLVLNPAPVVVTLDIVTLELPLFVSVTFEEPLAPKFKFPKLTLVGLAPNSRVGATPVPLSEIANGEPGALLDSEIEPVTAPAELGENTALKEAVLPGVIVNGTVKPVVLKPPPETVA